MALSDRARVKQSVAVRFLIEMSLVDFGCVSKREGYFYRCIEPYPKIYLLITTSAELVSARKTVTFSPCITNDWVILQLLLE